MRPERITKLCVLALTLGLAAPACSRTATGTHAVASPAAAPAPAPRRATCARVHPATTTAAPLGAPRAGSTVALATQAGATLAFVADEDGQAVQVVDVDARKPLGEVALGGKPSELMFLADGRLAVALRDTSQLVVLEPGTRAGTLEKLCAVETATEPVALALTPDDATVLVSSAWGRALRAFDARELGLAYEVALPREPRAVVVSDDGKFAYVAHAVGGLASRVTLADKTVTAISLRERDADTGNQERSLQTQIADLRKKGDDVPSTLLDQLAEIDKGAHLSCQGFALAKSTAPGGRILAPQVLVDSGDPHARATGYGNDDSPTEAADVAVIDAVTGRPLTTSLERNNDRSGWGNADTRDPRGGECLLPRAAVVDPSSKSLLVSCFGIDQVIAYDALAASPTRAERRRWPVGAGSTGIAVDGAHGRAVVWSQFDRALVLLDLGDGNLPDDRGQTPPTPARVTLGTSPSAPSTAMALGRVLFHTASDSRISRDGRACASCHPDGRDDSLVWATPDGPRRSIMLAGRVKGTAPYAWAGSEEDLRRHLTITFDRLNGAGGLKSVELEALTAYVESLSPPQPAPAPQDAQTRRGAELFASADVGCATCHSGPLGTDNQRHDVNSKTDVDKGREFNTPSLRFVGGTGPYFHDGRYRTLHDLLTATRDDMGHTSQLSPRDLEALEAYVGTL